MVNGEVRIIEGEIPDSVREAVTSSLPVVAEEAEPERVERNRMPAERYDGMETLSQDPLVVYLDEFLEPGECEALIHLAQGRMKRALVSLDGSSGVSQGRTGSNCWLRYQEEPLARRIGERVAKRVGFPLEYAEPLQVIHYGHEQEYRPHYDAYDLDTPRGLRCTRQGGQRMVTALLYLNEVEEGGATAFPNAGVEVAPRKGRIAIFNNVGADPGRPHPRSLHGGMPVKSGEKWAASIWFRARPAHERQPWFDDVEDASAQVPEGEGGHWPVVASNRAQSILQPALERAAPMLPPEAGDVMVEYCVGPDNQREESSEAEAFGLVVRAMPSSITNEAENKKNVVRKMKEAGHAERIPLSCDSISDAMGLPGARDAVWFVRPSFGSAGRGTHCVRGASLRGASLHPQQFLQLAEESLLLIRGRKFLTRAFVLVWGGAAYLFDEGYVLMHGAQYQVGSTNAATQMDHRNAHDPSGPLVQEVFHEVAQLKDSHWEDLSAAVTAVVEAFPGLAENSSATTFAVLGVDALFRENGHALILDISTMPNFVQQPAINDRVTIPLWVSIFEMLAGTGSQRFKRIT
ncbi:Procollagen-proline dioxygenase (plasmid) [Thioalkalivibrio sp. K90mix]|nr:Procollagen-proline dioxygenase [Thioalkalivibrio sp. K90mix]